MKAERRTQKNVWQNLEQKGRKHKKMFGWSKGKKEESRKEFGSGRKGSIKKWMAMMSNKAWKSH